MKEFTLFNGAAKIVGAGLSNFGIQIEVPDTIAIGAGIVEGITILGFLFLSAFKKEKSRQKRV
jgi:hypothetical protein